MRKRILGRAAAGVFVAALAAGALVATSTASTNGDRAATAAASTSSAPCILPAVNGPLAAVLSGSRQRKDLVTNQYDLPTPSVVSPFFAGPHTVKVYFHVIMNADDTGRRRYDRRHSADVDRRPDRRPECRLCHFWIQLRSRRHA
jgi:hypothetical protein